MRLHPANSLFFGVLLVILQFVLGCSPSKPARTARDEGWRDMCVADNFRRLGESDQARIHFEKAEIFFDKAIQLSPKYAEAYVARATMWRLRDDIEKAMVDITKALQLNPKLADAYNQRGLIYQKRGDEDTALSDFNKAVELNPKHIDAHINLGQAYLALKQFDEAIAIYTAAITSDPKNRDLYLLRGLAYGSKAQQYIDNKDKTKYFELMDLAAEDGIKSGEDIKK